MPCGTVRIVFPDNFVVGVHVSMVAVHPLRRNLPVKRLRLMESWPSSAATSATGTLSALATSLHQTARTTCSTPLYLYQLVKIKNWQEDRQDYDQHYYSHREDQ